MTFLVTGEDEKDAFVISKQNVTSALISIRIRLGWVRNWTLAFLWQRHPVCINLSSNLSTFESTKEKGFSFHFPAGSYGAGSGAVHMNKEAGSDFGGKFL